ncbi:hypothetical protein CKO08_08335 [Halorhodospira halochloris]|nr:hypothetical protein [Halorhodospira halochloris]
MIFISKGWRHLIFVLAMYVLMAYAINAAYDPDLAGPMLNFSMGFTMLVAIYILAVSCVVVPPLMAALLSASIIYPGTFILDFAWIHAIIFGVLILYLNTLYQAARSISVEHRSMSPWFVWLNLIPIWNIIWMFFTVVWLGRGLQAESSSLFGQQPYSSTWAPLYDLFSRNPAQKQRSIKNQNHSQNNLDNIAYIWGVGYLGVAVFALLGLSAEIGLQHGYPQGIIILFCILLAISSIIWAVYWFIIKKYLSLIMGEKSSQGHRIDALEPATPTPETNAAPSQSDSVSGQGSSNSRGWIARFFIGLATLLGVAQGASSERRLWWITSTIVGVVALPLALGLYQLDQNRTEMDSGLWSEARELDSAESYADYLENCTTCEREGRAEEKLQAAQDDERLWSQARDSDSEESYADYLENCTTCERKERAEEKLQAAQDDERLWSQARDSDSGESYADYLENCTTCERKERAEEKLQAAQEASEKWVFEGHDLKVKDVTVADHTVYSGGEDGIIRAIDSDTGEEQRVFEGHNGTIHSLAVSGETVYSSDSRGIVRATYAGDSGHTIGAYGAEAGEELWVFDGHDGMVRGVATDGNTVYSAGASMPLGGDEDETVRAILEGVEYWVFEGHDREVRDVAVDDDTVYSASADGTVRAIDSSTGNEHWVFEGHGASPVLGVEADGDTVFSAGMDNTVRAIDADTGSEQWIFEGHSSGVRSVAASGDTVYSASGGRGGDNSVRAIDAHTGKEQWVFEAHEGTVNGVAVKGDTVYSASDDGTVRAITPP